MTARARRHLRRVVAGAAGAAAAATLGGAATAGAATYFARRVVTPDRHRPDDVEVLAVGAGTVTLRQTPDTEAPGRYGLWLDGGRSHARLGEVVDLTPPTVTRQVVAMDAGRLRVGRARWNQYYWAGTPSRALGLPHEDVDLQSEVGALPAWVVPSPSGADGSTWAVLVHGRGASREECLRALPVLQRLAVPAVVPAYRNDPDAPHVPAGRYHLGDVEWRDVELAVRLALERGAHQVVLLGWSMGGAVALQLVSRSPLADRVAAVVLDAPVVDWRAVLDHHARLNRLPRLVGRLGLGILSSRRGRRLAGLEGPVDLRAMDWVRRASELRLPVLLIHSEDDEFVPCAPSVALAEARPDLVTLVSTKGARHTKEWNVDPEAWETAVEDWLRPRV